MILEEMPDDVLNIFWGMLDNPSLSAIHRTNLLFFNNTNNTITKRKCDYISHKLCKDANNLSLKTIEGYVDFLAMESSLTMAATSLIRAMQNTQEKLYEIQYEIKNEILPKDPDSDEKQFNQENRLNDLNEYYIKKFGLFGQIFKLIYAIEIDRITSNYSKALEMLYLIKLVFSNDHHPDVLKLINDYNKEIADYYKRHPDEPNEFVFLGKTELFISIDTTTKAIQIGGKPIDDVIHSIVQQALPEELYNNLKQDYIDFATGKSGGDPNLIDQFPDLNEIKNTPKFLDHIEETRLEAESNAKRIMDTINTQILCHPGI